MLDTVPTDERIELLAAFAQRVRSGCYGEGFRVGAATVQVALCAIGKTFELDGLPNPTYHCEGKYWLPIERLIESYRREDPPAKHKLAVPVGLVEYLTELGHGSSSAKVQAICDMSTVAFYFLLRVGEYTAHRRKDRRRTKQFRVCDVTFYDTHHNVIPTTSALTTLYTAAKATMKITNQKNGTRGTIISHDASGTTADPVRALARRVHHILQHPQCRETDIISTYVTTTARGPRPLQAADINRMVKSAARALGLDAKGFPPESVSSHSLRAGGAMAMHLNHVDRDTIRKQGRWSSDTFLMYIHEQISAFSAGLSTKMSQGVGWFNIAGPHIEAPGPL
jgi:hypothetical protein